ncbi:MAG: hypothetical protein KDE22_02675 [Rhodobacterales bacterium]|nr:hypothetical protein [Rhodobacterales bacterium]
MFAAALAMALGAPVCAFASPIDYADKPAEAPETTVRDQTPLYTPSGLSVLRDRIDRTTADTPDYGIPNIDQAYTPRQVPASVGVGRAPDGGIQSFTPAGINVSPTAPTLPTASNRGATANSALERVLRTYVNTAPGGASTTNIGGVNIADGQNQTRNRRASEDSQSPLAKLADEILADVVESVLTSQVDENGKITFSVLGLGQFEVNRSDDGQVSMMERGTGASVTYTDGGYAGHGHQGAAGGGDGTYRPTGGSLGFSLDYFLSSIFAHMVGSPVFWVLLVLAVMLSAVLVVRRVSH